MILRRIARIVVDDCGTLTPFVPSHLYRKGFFTTSVELDEAMLLENGWLQLVTVAGGRYMYPPQAIKVIVFEEG